MAKKEKKFSELSEKSSVEVRITPDDRKVLGNGGHLDYILPKQHYQSVWSSPEAFARYIEERKSSEAWHRAGWDKGDERFYGTKDMDTALVMARTGWKAGAEKIEKLRSMIKARRPMMPKLVRYDIAGATPNVPRAVAGNIFNMRAPDFATSRKRPVITLVANMSANCGISPDMISNRAAVLAALVDEIESSGFSCEVLVSAMSRGRIFDGEKGFKAATTIVVKESHQPVDIVRLAFSLGHASLFRRLVFADWGLEDSCKKGLGYGLGNAGDGFKKEEEELLEKNIFMLPSAETNSKLFKTDEIAMTQGLPYLIDHLKELKCPPFINAPAWEEKEAIIGKKKILLPEIQDDLDDDPDDDF